MRRVRINVGKVGVVSKSGDFEKVLTAGVYWLGASKSIKMFDMLKLYSASPEWKLKVENENFASMVEELEVKDNQVVLHFENDRFLTVLNPGSYFYWKGLARFKFVEVNLDNLEIDADIDKGLFAKYELNKYTRTYKVEPNEKAVLFVDGVYYKTLSGGVYRYWLNSQTITMNKTDMRQLTQEVLGQEILTNDKAALRLNFNTKYKVVDVEKALLDNKDYEKQLYVFTQLALREFIGGLSLDQVLESKEAVSDYVMAKLAKKAEGLGVKILDCGIKDIILPGEMKDIMNRVLIAQKQAQANVITRREETAATRSLLNTAKLMEENQMLFKLKEMEYVERIADKIGEISLSGNGQMIDQLKEIFSK